MPPPLLYDLTLASPWFELTRSGAKTFEGRVAWKQSRLLAEGDVLRIRHATDAQQAPFHSRVKDVLTFSSFEAGLHSPLVPLDAALPGVESVSAGAEIYQRFYPTEVQAQHGVLFIRTERIDDSIAQGITPAVRKISLWLQAKEGSEVSELPHAACRSRHVSNFDSLRCKHHPCNSDISCLHRLLGTARVKRMLHQWMECRHSPSSVPVFSPTERNLPPSPLCPHSTTNRFSLLT